MEQTKTCLELIIRLIKKILVSGVPPQALPSITTPSNTPVLHPRGGHGAGEPSADESPLPIPAHTPSRIPPRNSHSLPNSKSEASSSLLIAHPDRFAVKKTQPERPITPEISDAAEIKMRRQLTPKEQATRRRTTDDHKVLNDAMPNFNAFKNLKMSGDRFFFDEPEDNGRSEIDVLVEEAPPEPQQEQQTPSELPIEQIATLILGSPSTSGSSSRRSSVSTSPCLSALFSAEDLPFEGKVLFPRIFSATFTGDGKLVVISNLTSSAKYSRKYKRRYALTSVLC